MVTNVPEADDFFLSGLELLNLAWGMIFELYYHLDLSEVQTWDDDGKVRDEFWQASHRTLATALTLTHQAADTLLKRRIAEVSPFLLFSGTWPSGSSQADTPFSAFRTHDSQDLPRVHDAVASRRLSEHFVTLMDRLRNARNRAVHTVDKALRVSPEEVIRFILEISHELIGEREWISRRWEYLRTYPLSLLHSPDHIEWDMPSQVTKAVEILGAEDVERYFGINKKQRPYICLRCTRASDVDEPWLTALLSPNTPESEQVICFVCQEEFAVDREDCRGRECPGNVRERETGICLTCYAEHSVSGGTV